MGTCPCSGVRKIASIEAPLHSPVPSQVDAVVDRLSRGIPAYSPTLGLVAVPTGQVFYGTDWVAGTSIGSVAPPEEQLREWAKELAAHLGESTGEPWAVGPAELGPSLSALLQRQ
ncbi:hypothetical protein GCM10025867_47750 (plasmid) [Frondihabitans sucicola]|uniref:Uncharacterized protein n=1 Tax=Frondihabitans sucicola TaxID=1268041 RepID=A0ABN6Y5G9_9MICO|nr:hypothetical protein GCM10025867_47750 [Frondihabitans sucicola]